MSRRPYIYVYAETTHLAAEWCAENGIAPTASTTHLIKGANNGKGRMITGEDRVVFVGRVWRRRDHDDIITALAPALAEDARVEWVPR